MVDLDSPDGGLAVPAPPPLTPGARRVLDAASDLFYDQGIHAVGVDTIAEAAGVTKKTLYDRFGSKEALVVSYLRHRDARWREHLAAHLAQVPEPGVARVLAVFDAAVDWSRQHGGKGCSAINARAEVGDGHDGNAVFPEAARQKGWLLTLFAELCREAGLTRPDDLARTLMLVHEGAIVTVGMETFDQPLEHARSVARSLLEAAQAAPAA
ncbi:AcrR family transcriptional regulator [Frigoribacterium sp. PvP120]|uniref:TetR/AcrR family transcriptional regulator n=1 Tax=unclassified Frigoribacterium TaxID=2627005 RepID=UPI001AE4284A|nr:TetR/AcrR family transcriptional regulator [Frigoribacterium sp. PvP121]MBP1239801.1 AcrR family transcriptional regulator [Frigoribacterium sp. PvP121]